MIAMVMVALHGAPAGAVTQSASSRHVVATFSDRGSSASSKDLHLAIRVDGTVRYDESVVASLCATTCSPDIYASGQPVVHVVNLGPGNHRDVVLDLFSGGAHCCTIELVFAYDEKAKVFRKYQRDFGDPSARLVDLAPDGRYEFVSADDTFAYRFTDYAASGLPIEITEFAHHHFVDVTRQYPALVARDARTWMRAFTARAPRHYSDSVGVVAAWAADEDLLGHEGLVNHFLAIQSAAGHLNDGLGNLEPSGHAFVVALDRFLNARGYEH
jgi:hypothetical protein